MKLRQAQVQNFRSIVETKEVDLEERLTVLIGKNEQGKTTFLKALASFNSGYAYTPSDLPNHLRAFLEDSPRTEIPIVSLWFAPSPEDHAGLEVAFPDIGSVLTFKITKYFDGHYSYHSVAVDGTENSVEFTVPDVSKEVTDIQNSLEALRTKFVAHAARQPTFSANLSSAVSHLDAFLHADLTDSAQLDNLVNTLSTALTAVPGQDPPIQKDIAAYTTEIRTKTRSLKSALAQDATERFRDFLPTFVFHSTSLDKIPNEVSLAEFVKDPVKTSQGMANLCQAAGLTVQRINDLASSTDSDKRHAYEDHHKSYISGGLNEYWTQERYAVHFQFEKEKLSVSISDETYTRRIPPSERSDGFQWYLSFYSALLSTVSGSRPVVLLLDNPGLELHADGQRDIKKFLEEKLPWSTQVIYVTHSSAMIDPYRLEEVREVELLGQEQGSKVRRLMIKSGADSDLLEPVRSAIGASLINSLMFNEFNVLVEGAADKPILEGAFAAARKTASERIMVNGSIAESKELLPNFYERTKLPFVVYLDADSSGRALAQSLKNAGVPPAKIILLSDLIRRPNDFELEDILSDAFYRQAVVETYPERQLPDLPDGVGKRAKRYETLFKQSMGFDFSKHRVAVTVKKLLIEGKADPETNESVTTLTQKLLDSLQQQVHGDAKPGT